MSRYEDEFEAVLGDIEQQQQKDAVFLRVINDYPEELAMETLMAALRRGFISSWEAIRIVRGHDFDFQATIEALEALGDERGWKPQELVFEALEGQPH